MCHPDLEDLLQPWPAEVPDEFFEVTVDDVRRRLAQLKSERWVPLALYSSLMAFIHADLHSGLFLPSWGRIILKTLESKGEPVVFEAQGEELFC